MFELVGRWFVVFAFGYVVGNLYRIPAIFHFVERDSGRATHVEYRSIYAKRNSKPCFEWRAALFFFVVPFGVIVCFWAFTNGVIVEVARQIQTNPGKPAWVAIFGSWCFAIVHLIAHYICYLVGTLIGLPRSLSHKSSRQETADYSHNLRSELHQPKCCEEEE